MSKSRASMSISRLRRSALHAAQAEFAAWRVRKTYWAVVRGVPATEAGTIDAPLLRLSTRDGWCMVIDDAGKAAVTDWRLLGQVGNTAWLEVTPHTGRTHQVRVHSAALGFPVIGDPVYDGGSGPLQLLAHGLALLLDPPLSVVAPVPAHMREALHDCGSAIG
jgi:tRNA pseudouridine32 synthase/23S rRNA pseudouridine746 synthase